MKTRILVATTLFTALVGSSANTNQFRLPLAKLTVSVRNESSEQIAGVNVSLAFMDPTGQGIAVKGLTDANGLFTGSGGSDSSLGGSVTKVGYYRSGFPFTPFRDVKDDHWQPWDATYTSVLRKIENPVPMYAKRAIMKSPVVGKACGYDLKVGDWVSPWGKGLVPDFVFTVSCDYTNFNHYDASMKLSFSNPLDGIQAAKLPTEYAYGEFIWHRQAPDTGYIGGYEQEKGIPKKLYRIPSAPTIRRPEGIEKQKFYFRVRTVEKDGKIVSALYGKLSQGFDLWASNSTNVSVRTCYYLNPTALDQNMEFDLEKNLFKNLNVEEQPRRP